MGASFRQTIAALFANKRMNTDVMLHGHVQATLKRAAQRPHEYLIAVQDTTLYNYCGHKAMQGLGLLQQHIKGIAQHNVLLLDQTGLPLGLLDQQYWSRQGSVPYEGTESLKWTRGLQAVNKQLAGSDKKVVVVQDREADMLSLFKAPRQQGVELLVRLHQPRKLQLIHSGQVTKLAELPGHLDSIADKQVGVLRGGKSVQLTLRLQACRVHVLPNKDKSAHKHKSEPMSVVIATEVAAVDELGQDVFEEQQAAQWYLLSTLGIEGRQEVERVVDFYALRWRIERFHYTLKSGALNVERLQFDDVSTMINALTFYSVVAWQLLALSYQLRAESQGKAEVCFEAEEISVLEAVSKKKVETLEQAVLALGKIVGFARSKKQPLPGVRMLAQALERLYYLKKGYQAAAP